MFVEGHKAAQEPTWCNALAAICINCGTQTHYRLSPVFQQDLKTRHLIQETSLVAGSLNLNNDKNLAAVEFESQIPRHQLTLLNRKSEGRSILY